MIRQQRRRIGLKQQKRDAAREAANRTRLYLAEMRLNRNSLLVPDRHPGSTLLTPSLAQQCRAPGSRRGKPNRRIVATKVQRVPALTKRIGRQTVVLVPERRYENTFHATKGPRSVRTCA